MSMIKTLSYDEVVTALEVKLQEQFSRSKANNQMYREKTDVSWKQYHHLEREKAIAAHIELKDLLRVVKEMKLYQSNLLCKK